MTGLEASRSYELLLLAGRDGETEQVGVRLTASTTSSSDGVDSDGGAQHFIVNFTCLCGW